MFKVILLFLVSFALIQDVSAQKSKSSDKNAPVLDQKKLAKANALVAEAMKLKDKEKQSQKLNEAVDIYREQKYLKEGSIMIGDAFYNIGDLKTASRWYAKGGKENKTETNKKVGEAYLEEALKGSDPKSDKKALSNAYKSLSKAVGAQEANRLIGNEYFNMGVENYPKALEYYEKAGYNEGISMIADLYAADPEKTELAAETYSRTKEKVGYKKAGDLFYNRGDYVKAIEYYAKGGVMEGYMKYANELKKNGKVEMANSVYEVVADSFKANNKADDIRDMAITAEKENNYPLAASLYAKLDEKELALKYSAYREMMSMEFSKAKEIFQALNREDMTADIDKNTQTLTALQQSDFVLRELQKNVPKVNTKTNPYNGKLEYDKRDLDLVSKYYGNPQNQKTISETVYSIGTSFAKLKCNDELRNLVRNRFLKYAPVKNILDNYNFAKKIVPANITPAAVSF